MTIRYVGPGGSDGADGLSWANRKLTLTGAEDSPVAAGDIIYVGPGVYRETLAVDVDGSDGSPITYIGDVTGENTDGVGGIVRWTTFDTYTGSPIRTYLMWNQKKFRHYKNFTTEHSAGGGAWPLYFSAEFEGCLLENWVFSGVKSSTGQETIRLDFTSGSVWDIVIRGCYFVNSPEGEVIYTRAGGADRDAPIIVENCYFKDCAYGLNATDGYNVIVRNNTVLNARSGINVTGTSAQIAAYLYQNMGRDCLDDFGGASGPVFVHGHNVSIDPSVSGGTNIASIPYFDMPLLLNGFKFPDFVLGFNLNNRTPVTHHTDTGAPSTDMFGITRPASGKKTPGFMQYKRPERETTIVSSGNTSAKVADAGKHIYQVILNGAVAHTFSVDVYREADYTGTLPQMIVKRIGQTDEVITDVGAAGQFNKLTFTFTPGVDEKYAQIEFTSNNTATSGDYGIYFDKFLAKSKDVRTKSFITNEIYITNFNKKPVDDVWITLSTVVLSPAVEPFDSHLPPYIN